MMKASTKFPDWTQDEAIAYECACETITHVIGICTAMIEEERNGYTQYAENYETECRN